MRKLKLFMTAVMLLCVQLVIAQSRTVTGRVTEAGGAPLVGATISADGKPLGITDAQGQFSLSVPTSVNTLEISSVGFATKTVNITGAALSIELTADGETISEVVVTGYTSISRKKFSGASVAVNAESVRQQTFGSFDQAIQGKAPGVSVISNTGQPGANAIVRIRGNGSISGGNVPLYIMDGIEISAADFSSINQADIENLEVLKDAVATSMYGSRGANGVLVITTRRGKAGQLLLNYDAQLGFSNLPQDRITLMNSQQKIDYELQRGNPYDWSPAEADSLRNINFNWRDALFQTGMTHQHMVSASGGSKTSRFYGSLSYMDQEGTVRNTGMQRYTARLNVDNEIKNWRFGITMQGGYSRLRNTAEANTFLSSPLNAVRWSNPYERDRDPRTGEFQETGGAGTGQLTSGQPNGAMELFLNKNNRIQAKAVATTYLEYHFPFLKGLYARTNWGVDYTQNETENYTDYRTSVGAARDGILSRGMNRNLRYTGTTSLNYKTTFSDKHELEAGVFTEVVKNRYRSFGFTGYGLLNGFSNEAGLTPGSAANEQYIPSLTGSGTENGIMSYFGIVNYGYDNKYFLTLVGRRDGSSRFGANNRWANFGSVGLTWSLIDENFMSGQNLFNDLRLRASIGTNGNNNTAAGDYGPLPLFARTSYAGASGWVPDFTNPGNAGYRWETNRTINFGIDFGMLSNRISGTVELYDRKTTDLFYNLNIDPSTTGSTVFPSNFGSLRNRGIELLLRGDVIRTKDFRWTLEGNLTYNQNRILDLPRDSVISGVTILAEGFPVNSLFLVEYAGVNPDNGNAQYINRGKETTTSFNVNDKVIWGTSDAPWFGGISTTIAYKGFDLNAQLNFFLNREMYNNDLNNLTNPAYLWDNVTVDLLKEWQQPGDITNVPRPSSGTLGGTAPANPYQAQTTRFLEDASFWRLRNVTLGYTVPASVMSKLKIRSARVFVQGINWWTSTKYRSFDPEVSGTSLVGAQYPALVQTTFGLSVGF